MLPKEEGPVVDPCPKRCRSPCDVSLKAVLYRIASIINIPGRVPSRRAVVFKLGASRTVEVAEAEQQAALVVDPSG